MKVVGGEGTDFVGGVEGGDHLDLVGLMEVLEHRSYEEMKRYGVSVIECEGPTEACPSVRYRAYHSDLLPSRSLP